MRRLVFKLEDEAGSFQVLIEIPDKGVPRLATRPNSYSAWGPPRPAMMDVTEKGTPR